jgi:hypothetical protein
VTQGRATEIVLKDPEDTQTAAWNEANRACNDRLVASGLMVADSTDTLRAEYRSLSELLVCLVTAGFSLVDWPSEEVHVEAERGFNVFGRHLPGEAGGRAEGLSREFDAADAVQVVDPQPLGSGPLAGRLLVEEQARHRRTT